MVPVPKPCFRSRLIVYHKDKNGVLHCLQNFDFLESVLDEVSRGKTPTKPWLLSRADQERMQEIGLNIQPRQLDFVVEFPWDASSLITIVANKTNDKELRRRVLVMALDRIRSTPTLTKILAAKGLPSCTIRENPYLGAGHPPHENFVESLLAIVGSGTRGGEKLFELLLESTADEADETAFNLVEKQGVKTVFHGTNHAVMDAILNSGLDPSCRRRGTLEEDYFGLHYRTSLEYTKQKTQPSTTKLLVFMIIVKPHGPGRVIRSTATVESNRFQLPLAEIELDTYCL